jgi:septal ring factor EnvC (AmiA/AmiB activator)
MPRVQAKALAFVLSAWLAAGAAGYAASRTEQARRQAEAAEAARAAALAAQKEAEARAAQARAMLEGLAAQRMHAVARLREAEQRALKAADRMAELAQAERQAQEALSARAAAIGPLLPVIERLSLFPTETLLAVPASPEEAVRGLIVLQGVAHRLEAEALALRRDQARLAKARSDLAAEAPVLADAKAAQQQAADELERRAAAAELDRDAAEREAEAEAARAAELAAKSATLRALLERLETARKEQEARARAEARKEAAKKRKSLAEAGAQEESAGTGPLLVPVAGSVARGWGAPTEAGPAMGISYRTAPNAKVVSPCRGTVAFAAPFRSYGDLLIMSCGGGVNAVLAGFAKLTVHPGQKLRRGDPVGSMPDWSPSSPGPHPTLYVELRNHGEPVNPGPLLRTS